MSPFPAGPSRAWLPVTLLALAYVLINFVLTKNSLSPIHQDDYLALGYGYEDMRWNISRPVSTNLIYFLGAMGPSFAFLFLLVATIAMAVLVLRFQERVFREALDGRGYAWPYVLLIAAFAFAHMASYEHGKLLGLATTLSSNVAGLLALCLLWDAWSQHTTGKAIGGVLAYLIGVFAKEDFILPPLVLLVWLWAMRLRETRSLKTAFGRFEVTLTLAMGLAAIGSVAYGFVLSSNPFVSGLSGDDAIAAPYAVNLGPTALATAFWKLTIGYAPVASVLTFAAFVVGPVFLPRLRWPLVLMAGLLFALMLPYAMIPNNMPEFRVYGWLPWFGGIVAAVIAGIALLPQSAVSSRAAKSGTSVAALALAGVVVFQANGYRQAVAAWYVQQQAVNTNMLESLHSHRSEIAREPVVGIVGVDGLSPWSNTDAQYLHRKLYFDNKWIVFVDKDSMFFRVDPIVDGRAVSATGKQFITVQSTTRICALGDMLLLTFDEAGTATVKRSQTWCAVHASGAATK